MSRHIVILVHGMGTHKKGEMSKQFCSGINETAKNFAFKNFDIAKEVELVEFNYSDDFDNIRKKLAEKADTIKDQGFSALAGTDIVQEIIEKLTGFESSLDDDSMFTTHWLDVILYGSTHFGEGIRSKFATLLNEQIKNAKGKKIHIICHSLGTAVVHDTLAKVYREDADIMDHIPDLPTGAFNLDTLWMFANVSSLVNLLNGLEDPRTSLVTSGPDGCTDLFYNIYHTLDPFTWFKTYNREMISLISYKNKVVRTWNTHDFKEYIGDPLVTKELLNTLTYKSKQNNSKNLAKCMQLHKKDTINDAVKQLSEAKESFKDKPITSFKDAFDAIEDIMNIVKKFKEEMKNENK